MAGPFCILLLLHLELLHRDLPVDLEPSATMYLTAQQQALIREWILAGRSDEEIAQALLISVKLVRPIRAALEQVLRPR